MVITKDLGMIALGIYMLLIGLVSVFKITFQGEEIVLGVLALIAGVLILIKMPGRL